MKFMNKNKVSISLVALSLALCGTSTLAQQVITSNGYGNVQDGSSYRPNFEASTLDNVEPLGQQDSVADIGSIIKAVEDANAIEQIQADDPLIGLSPDQRAMMNAMQSVNPMTPAQIKMFRKRLDATIRAENERLRPAPSTVTRTISLTLAPNEAIPEIRTQNGSATTLTIGDREGNPWPVERVIVGNPAAFNAMPAGTDGESNIIVINPITEYGSTNLVVTIKGSSVPVILTVKAEYEEEVDYRVDVKIMEKGPNASFDVTTSYNLPSTNDSLLLSFLDGLPPKEAIKLETGGARIDAWEYQDELYVVTRGLILAPDYRSSATSVSGNRVYIMGKVPVVTVSTNGIPDTAYIEFN